MLDSSLPNGLVTLPASPSRKPVRAPAAELARSERACSANETAQQAGAETSGSPRKCPSTDMHAAFAACLRASSSLTSRCSCSIAGCERIFQVLWRCCIEPIRHDAGMHLLSAPASRLALPVPAPAREPMQGAGPIQARLEACLQHLGVPETAIESLFAAFVPLTSIDHGHVAAASHRPFPRMCHS